VWQRGTLFDYSYIWLYALVIRKPDRWKSTITLKFVENSYGVYGIIAFMDGLIVINTLSIICGLRRVEVLLHINPAAVSKIIPLHQQLYSLY
jgi:hypothetical protein